MKSFTEIAGMGEFRKKKKPETKKKKDERGKTKVTASRDDVARTDNKGARKRIIDSPKSEPSFKPPKAKARPERQEKSQSRFRGFVAPPRETKKETTPKPTTSSIMSATGKQGKNQRKFLRRQKAEKMKKDFKTRGEMSRHSKKYDESLNRKIYEKIHGQSYDDFIKQRDNRRGGGKIKSKFFTGGMVNPSYGTDFDDR